jgi:hypothetical protein
MPFLVGSPGADAHPPRAMAAQAARMRFFMAESS